MRKYKINIPGWSVEADTMTEMLKLCVDNAGSAEDSSFYSYNFLISCINVTFLLTEEEVQQIAEMEKE